MERTEIIKALECCHTPLASDCNYCGYRGQSVENGEYIGCTNRLMKDALSLIKELTEEIERLSGAVKMYEEERKYHFEMSRKKNAETKADTVRKMHSEIEARCIKGGIYPAFVARTIDQIAKELESEVLNYDT